MKQETGPYFWQLEAFGSVETSAGDDTQTLQEQYCQRDDPEPPSISDAFVGSSRTSIPKQSTNHHEFCSKVGLWPGKEEKDFETYIC